MNVTRFGQAFGEEFPTPQSKLFSELIWPAAAGNVAWAFLQLVLVPPTLHRWAFRSLLALMALYLAVDWLRSAAAFHDEHGQPIPRSRKYWIGDAALVIIIVVVAIAAQAGKSLVFLHLWLALLFVAAAISHAFGVWEGAETNSWSARKRRRSRVCMSMCAVLGLAVMVGGYSLYDGFRACTLPISFGSVFIAWLTVRTIRNDRHKGEPPEAAPAEVESPTVG